MQLFFKVAEYSDYQPASPFLRNQTTFQICHAQRDAAIAYESPILFLSTGHVVETHEKDGGLFGLLPK